MRLDFDDRQRSWWEDRQLKLGIIVFTIMALVAVLLILMGILD